MNQNDFLKQQRAAVDKMREMNSRSKFKETSQNTPKSPQTVKTNIGGASLGLPFLDSLLSDSDSVLIIALLLILMSENTDKTLLFALVYILL